MTILVLSCDKNSDIFDIFHHCMEKYWRNHPEVVYMTESVENPYYKTICKDYPIDKWTRRVRETLGEIDDDKILVMVDDVFIRSVVDVNRVKYVESLIDGNVAFVNFEKSFDENDIDIGLNGIKKRRHGAMYEISMMCGMWSKNKLLRVIESDSSPWGVEIRQNNCNFDYYINSGEYIIDWGYRTWQWFGLCKGKWCREVVDFFEREGIEIDYEKRGFIN